MWSFTFWETSYFHLVQVILGHVIHSHTFHTMLYTCMISMLSRHTLVSLSISDLLIWLSNCLFFQCHWLLVTWCFFLREESVSLVTCCKQHSFTSKPSTVNWDVHWPLGSLLILQCMLTTLIYCAQGLHFSAFIIHITNQFTSYIILHRFTVHYVTDAIIIVELKSSYNLLLTGSWGCEQGKDWCWGATHTTEDTKGTRQKTTG